MQLQPSFLPILMKGVVYKMDYKLNKEVFYRFEPNIDDGILLVYFKGSNEIYEMTESISIF